jgi:hypothetical protein
VLFLKRAVDNGGIICKLPTLFLKLTRAKELKLILQRVFNETIWAY